MSETGSKNSTDVLSEIVIYNKYAKYIPELNRRETWTEIVDRYLNMMIKKYPLLKEEISEKGKLIYAKKILPSMRALQFSGPAVEKNETRLYNCSYLPMDNYKAFSELMFLLLGGTGVGYSVQFHHVESLPSIRKPLKENKYLIGDSIEGWADAIKALMKSYFGASKVKPRFDYSDIRPKGARLVTAGGKAPGPGPLRVCLAKIEAMLAEKQEGHRLSPLEVHDICCHIADAVLAGGIRRAALISLFSFDDKDMLTCKFGNWWELNSQRGRANNSAVILRNRIKKEEFLSLWETIKESNSGEPGFYFTNDPEYGTNPCCEISLRPNTFCNLTEINGGDITSQEDFNTRCTAGAFFGTLQAGFTDFHYLRPVWRKNTEKDALIGVGITGIASGVILPLDLEEASDMCSQENERVARLLGINPAARVTTIKPSGTSSLVIGSSSGIHAWHSKKYIRNMQCRVGDDLYEFFHNNYPDLIKVMDLDPHSAVIGVPVEAPDTAILREEETALQLLERVLRFNIEWVKTGHRSGPNTNNVSATISIRDEEWEEVGEWMWKHKADYNGLSVLPFSDHSYKDAPFQEVSEEEWKTRMEYLNNHEIDLTLIKEEEDHTDLKGEIACAGNSCEINL